MIDTNPEIFEKFIVCDIDGTLADDSHRVQYIPDWDAYHDNCDQDKPFTVMIDIIKELSLSYPLVIITERNENNRSKTSKWLIDNEIYVDQLLMRPDYSPLTNSELKWKLLCDLCDGEENVLDRVFCVFEDNDKIVEMWRNKNLTCLQPRIG